MIIINSFSILSFLIKVNLIIIVYVWLDNEVIIYKYVYMSKE